MQNKTKIVATFSFIDYAKEFIWYAQYIDKEKFELICVFYHPFLPKIIDEISRFGVKSYWIKYNGKRDLPLAILKTLKLFAKLKPFVLHAQLFDASLISMISAWILKIPHRIYTRHHADLHHIYHPKAVKYDKLINNLSKKIICPTQRLKNILITKEAVNENKIVVIPHGFVFDNVNKADVEKYKKDHKLIGYPIIGVISRFTHWKGVQFIVEAYKLFIEYYPESIIVFAGYKGDYENVILEKLKSIPTKNYKLIEFEKNNSILFSVFDIFVHTPISSTAESFGQIYVESIAYGVPSIITLSGIAKENDLFEKFAYVVPYEISRPIFDGLMEITKNLDYYKEKTKKAALIFRDEFNFEKKIKALEKIYNEFIP
jgi:glycosyltransferase involved in cell wall biosynthesis